ncbi:MAG: glucose-6-phosphate dehydrogenase [Planctomycetes bacterium]|nr:glucose-6-phosphate dehydrogenase [Planctomycetota bacterium]
MAMRTADPCVLVILGASGDLTSRKLIPAMYEMAEAGLLNPATCVLGVSRTPKSDEAWRDELKPWIQKQVKNFRDEVWKEFSKRIFYLPGDAATSEPYARLSARVAELDAQRKCAQNILFFMSVAPELYEPIVAQIDAAGMVTEGRRWCSVNRNMKSWQRIIVEKPFGFDDESAASLNRALGRVFEEDAIYRIDHYLGKEVVQNLLVFRFANALFEPVWNHRYIDHVQITAVETVGVGQRTAFYDKTGAIRDMIQSHLLQVLAFVAMEPPTTFSADHIRGEKIKVIDALQTPPIDRIAEWGALGQYSGDATEGAYHELKGVDPNSTTETFAALKMHFDNWRWSNVPFFLRTGKRMAKKSTQVVVQFKPPAANLFKKIVKAPLAGNRITIDIAPNEQFRIRFNAKVPGPMDIKPVEMEMDYVDSFHSETVEAYGPLMIDAMRGDQSLFKHRLEVESAWHAIMPFLNKASAPLRKNIQGNYAPGSWGPKAAEELMTREGRAWAV